MTTDTPAIPPVVTEHVRVRWRQRFGGGDMPAGFERVKFRLDIIGKPKHWLAQHRLHADQVYHFLTLMLCYRDKRKAKPKAHGEVG